MLPRGAQAAPDHWEALLGFGPNAEKYKEAELKNEASTIAAIHTLRSMYDLFAQLIRGLLLEDKLTEGECNIHKVCASLPSSRLKEYVGSILDSDSFQYVNAFANVSKHQFLVKHGMTITLADNSASVGFEAFKYTRYGKTKNFPALDSITVLERCVDCQNMILRAGDLLNSVYAETHR